MKEFEELKVKLLKEFSQNELDALGIDENTWSLEVIKNILAHKKEYEGLIYAMSWDLNDLYQASQIQRY